MHLDVGLGQKPRGDVNADIRHQYKGVKNFVQCDARYLPFRSKIFDLVTAYNVLEHIKEYEKAYYELHRVGQRVIIRTDSLLSFANWFHYEHEYITFGMIFIRRPFILRLIGRLVYKIVDPNHTYLTPRYQRLRRILVKANLLDRWSPYEV